MNLHNFSEPLPSHITARNTEAICRLNDELRTSFSDDDLLRMPEKTRLVREIEGAVEAASLSSGIVVLSFWVSKLPLTVVQKIT